MLRMEVKTEREVSLNNSSSRGDRGVNLHRIPGDKRGDITGNRTGNVEKGRRIESHVRAIGGIITTETAGLDLNLATLSCSDRALMRATMCHGACYQQVANSRTKDSFHDGERGGRGKTGEEEGLSVKESEQLESSLKVQNKKQDGSP